MSLDALTTWTELRDALNSVAEGEVFAQGVDTDYTYDCRLRRHGHDVIAEIRTHEGGDWTLVDTVDGDTVDGDGVMDIRDIDTDVTFYRTN